MNCIVKKPWGIEYKCFSNDEVAIWALEIKKGEATSLHCHPKKNTALIVLRGEVELSFIRDVTPHHIIGLGKINIFRGRFHRTRAVTHDVVLLEIEAPDNKRDIVRLEDNYNREGKPIEEATQPLTTNCLQITANGIPHRFADCWLVVRQINQAWNLAAEQLFVTLTGGLEHGLVPPGDAIDGATLTRLIRSFEVLPGTTFLQIWKTP